METATIVKLVVALVLVILTGGGAATVDFLRAQDAIDQSSKMDVIRELMREE